MSYALTVKSQVTVPKAIRQHLGVQPGQEIDYEPLPDGSVRLYAVHRAAHENPFSKWVGAGIAGQTTDEILRETRGEDWNR